MVVTEQSTTEKKKPHQPDRAKYAYVYAKTREDKQRWQEMADEAGYSLSTFLQGLIEDGIAYREGALSKEELFKKINDLEIKNRELDEDLTNAKLRIKSLIEEVKAASADDWTDEGFEGFRGYDLDLIKILKDHHNLSRFALIDKLGLDPKDVKSIEAVEKQLESLESHRIIKRTIRGWSWL
jgi:hypothetical protein